MANVYEFLIVDLENVGCKFNNVFELFLMQRRMLQSDYIIYENIPKAFSLLLTGFRAFLKTIKIMKTLIFPSPTI